jgi:DNA-binding Lrp family transcriptional regulator
MSYELSVPNKVLQYITERETVSVEDIARDLKVSPITAKNYLSRLARMGMLKGISRGLYQLKKGDAVSMKLSPELLQLTQEIRERFPMGNFVIWSLSMLADYAHYSISRDIIFIEASKILSASLRDALIAKGYRVTLLPENRDFWEYAYYKERPLFILERKELYGLVWLDGNFVPTLERVWIDLFYFITRKQLKFDPSELGTIIANIIDREGMNFDLLLRYAGRRGLFREVLVLLYEMKRSGSRVGRKIPEYVLLGRHETLDTILEIAHGARRE